jgi:hypothetical protein
MMETSAATTGCSPIATKTTGQTQPISGDETRPTKMKREPQAGQMSKGQADARVARNKMAPTSGPVCRFFLVVLIVVATAFLARDHAAVAPLDRSGHRPAVSPWANGHAAWADADGGV